MNLKSSQIVQEQDARLRARYLREPWGRFLEEYCGMDPVHTESSARSVAGHAAEVLKKRDEQIVKLKKRRQEIDDEAFEYAEQIEQLKKDKAALEQALTDAYAERDAAWDKIEELR